MDVSSQLDLGEELVGLGRRALGTWNVQVLLVHFHDVPEQVGPDVKHLSALRTHVLLWLVAAVLPIHVVAQQRSVTEVFSANLALEALEAHVDPLDVWLDSGFVAEQLAADLTAVLDLFHVNTVQMSDEGSLAISLELAVRIVAVEHFAINQLDVVSFQPMIGHRFRLRGRVFAYVTLQIPALVFILRMLRKLLSSHHMLVANCAYELHDPILAFEGSRRLQLHFQVAATFPVI